MKLTENILQVLKDKKISIEDLNDRYFFVESNILKLLNENICSSKDIVDKFKSIRSLDKLIQNKEFFEELFENNKLSKDDTRYLLNKIDNIFELEHLSKNTPLIKHILNEFVLNTEDVDKFNRITNECKWCKEENIHTVFDWIEFYAIHEWDSAAETYCRKSEVDQELLELNELNKYTYTFDLTNFNLTKDQRLKLIEVLRDNEIAKNRLIQIIDNHLESNYDFESLMSYLKKSEKKTILTT